MNTFWGQSVTETKIIFTVYDYELDSINATKKDRTVATTKEFAFESYVCQLTLHEFWRKKKTSINDSKELNDCYYRWFAISLDLKSDYQGQFVKMNYEISFIDSENQMMFSSGNTLYLKPKHIYLKWILAKDLNQILKVDDKISIAITLRLYNLFSPMNRRHYRHIKSFNVKDVNDFEIICGQKRFFVSKAILSSSSVVFKTMFANDMKEKETNQLVVEDIDENVMDQFLKYLYSWHSNKLDQFKEELLYVSEKYDVLDLKSICDNLMFLEINAKNAIKLLITFDEYNCLSTKDKTIKFIALNFAEIQRKKTNEWLDLMKFKTKLANDIISLVISSPPKPPNIRLKRFTFSYTY